METQETFIYIDLEERKKQTDYLVKQMLDIYNLTSDIPLNMI